ncbi:MAG: hypothetical protein V3T39_03195 [Gammaproteobacteria bacterium]
MIDATQQHGLTARYFSSPITRVKESVVNVATIFAATGTLVCCAFPILLVTFGFGSVVVSLTTALPWLIPIAQQKAWVFAGSGVLLMLSGWFLYRPGRACPTNPALAQKCARIDKWNRRIYWGSIGLWMIGFFAAYLLLPVSRLFGY